MRRVITFLQKGEDKLKDFSRRSGQGEKVIGHWTLSPPLVLMILVRQESGGIATQATMATSWTARRAIMARGACLTPNHEEKLGGVVSE